MYIVQSRNIEIYALMWIVLDMFYRQTKKIGLPSFLKSDNGVNTLDAETKQHITTTKNPHQTTRNSNGCSRDRRAWCFCEFHPRAMFVGAFFFASFLSRHLLPNRGLTTNFPPATASIKTKTLIPLGVCAAVLHTMECGRLWAFWYIDLCKNHVCLV